jgi:hypothetical protein
LGIGYWKLAIVIGEDHATWKIIGSASEDTPGDPTPSGVESDARTLLFFRQFPRCAALAALDFIPFVFLAISTLRRVSGG